MTYVLFVILVNFSTGVSAITTIDFKTEKQCLIAAKEVRGTVFNKRNIKVKCIKTDK